MLQRQRVGHPLKTRRYNCEKHAGSLGKLSEDLLAELNALNGKVMYDGEIQPESENTFS